MSLQKEKKSSYHNDKETKKRQRQIKRRIEEIEIQMEELEDTISRQNELLCDPGVYQNHEKVIEINTIIENANIKLESLMEEWSLLESEQE